MARHGMTIEGKPIAIMFVLQFAGVVVFDLGGIVGQNIMRKLHEGSALPHLTQSCVNLGLWPLAVPLVWVVIAFIRSQRDAPYLEMLVWLAIAVAFFIIMTGWGLIAAIIPLVVIVS